MHKTNEPSLAGSFRRLAFSNLLAHSADQIGLAATPIVAVLVLNAGAGTTAVLQIAQTLPFLLLSLPLGLLADYSRRSRLMAAGEMLRGASLLLVCLLAVTGYLTLPNLAILGFVGTVGTVAYTVAAPSLITTLVKRSLLSVANGRIELVRSGAYALGPAAAGMLIGWIGGSWTYAVAAALSIVAVLALAGINEPRLTAQATRHPIDDVRHGIRFLMSHELLKPIVLTAVVFNASWFCIQSVYVAYAISTLGHSSSQVGVVLASYGVGMLAGALAAPYIIGRLPFGRVVVIGPIAGLTAALVLTMTVWTPFVGIPMSAFFMLGAGPIIWTISTTTLRQSVTPITMLGRVSASLTMATAGARPIGSGIGALIVLIGGVEWCLYVAAAGFLAQAVIIASSPAATLNQQPSHVEAEFA